MRIFIAGATGVIGRRAVPLLLARGHDVTVATRGNGQHASLWGREGKVKTARVDLFDPTTLAPAIDGHDTVINLATHIPSSSAKTLFRRSWLENDRVRRLGSRNLVAASLATGVKRFVQESYAPVYPDRGDAWIDESVPLEPADFNRTVLDAEESARQFSAAGRVGVTLRFAVFYGPDAMQATDYIKVLRWGWVPMPGERRAFISSVSHDDAATAVVAALGARSGEYNISDDEPLRREDFFGSLASVIGAPTPRFPPDWSTRLLGAVGELLARSLRISNGKFRAETGWAPRYPSAREGWVATLAEMAAR